MTEPEGRYYFEVTKTPVGAPWSRVPAILAISMAPKIAQVQAQIVRLIESDQLWTRQVADPKIRADMTEAASIVVERFVGLIGTAEATFTEPERARFRELGAGEARDGRGLEQLLAAYRVGARVIYTEFASALSQIDPSPQAQLALGEAVFALMDALHSASAEGYSNEVATHAGERERRLRRLVEAILCGDEGAVRLLAPQVGWPVPESVTVVLLPPEGGNRHPVIPSASGLVVERGGLLLALLNANPQLSQTIGQLGAQVQEANSEPRALRVGPIVPLLEAGRSLAVAQLLPEGAGVTALHAQEWLPSLLMRAAPEVAETLRRSLLAPLQSLREPQRVRLVQTLDAWLRHWGQRAVVAAELSVHPQTVAYRMNQLRDLFGDALDDPQWRLEMQLALL